MKLVIDMKRKKAIKIIEKMRLKEEKEDMKFIFSDEENNALYAAELALRRSPFICNMKAKVIMEYLETLKEIRDTVKGDKALAISFGINELGIADMFCDIARHDFWGEPVPDRLG